MGVYLQFFSTVLVCGNPAARSSREDLTVSVRERGIYKNTLIQIVQQLIQHVNKYKRVCSIFHMDNYKLIITLWLSG
jgi:hypothetical protein